MNDWYKKGKMPPVGEVVEYFNGDNWIGPATVFHITKGGVCFVEYPSGHYDKSAFPHEFRPLRTEEDKLVDAVEKILDGCENVSNRAIAYAIINAGYRKLKPRNEDDYGSDEK